MADDGMLLNFAIPDDAFSTKVKFKGGNWKDRLTARKSAEYGRGKAKERAQQQRHAIPAYEEHGSDEELITANPRPAKRARTGDGYRPVSRPEQRSSMASGEASRSQPARSGPREVVSSLFTYNPKPTVEKSAPPAEAEGKVEPSNAPLNDELSTFTSLGLSPTLASHLLNKLNIKAPTAVQRKAVAELVKQDTDAFIQAETGSGKTLAYLLPIVQRIMNLSKTMKDAGEDFSRESGLFAIILAPTRELSKQISTVLDDLLACGHWIVGGTVIGGEKKKSEKARLRKGLNILVATPGRLADHLNNTEVLDVSKVRWLVLDEGDRLMELGFENDIQKIVSVLNLRSRKVQERPIPGLPDRRTTVLCSATIKSDVDRLGSIALKDAVSISAEKETRQDGADDTGFSAPAQLKQSHAIVPAKQRLVTLVAVLKSAFRRKGSVMKAIVFISCADSVDFHFEVLTRQSGSRKPARGTEGSDETTEKTDGVPQKRSRGDKIPQGGSIPEARTQGPASAISSKENAVRLFRLHGSLAQNIRTETLKGFTTSTEPAVLVCTDVASRGLDLPNVDLVIEYDPPFSKDDHLHRIGRTARAGRDGRAMIFLQPGCEEGYVEILKEGKPRNLTRHDADELLKKGFAASTGVVSSHEWEDRATDWQLDVERWALESPKHLEQARRAFQSHIRAYATHVAAERGIFDLKQMHLGHLAKAFALRDKPGSLKVPGLRPSKDSGNKTREARRVEAKKFTFQQKQTDHEVPAMTDEQEARRKMRIMAKGMGGASEFNLG